MTVELPTIANLLKKSSIRLKIHSYPGAKSSGSVIISLEDYEDAANLCSLLRSIRKEEIEKSSNRVVAGKNEHQ